MKKLFWIIASVLAFAPSLARAEVFIWEDPTYNVQVAFPDNWMRQAQLQPDLRLFIVAPQGQDHAACRLTITHDGRFMEAPAAAGLQVSAYVFDANMVLQQFYNRPDTNYVHLSGYNTTASLGAAAAIMTQVDFQKTWMGMSVPMHAIAVASQYNGNRIFMSCEAMSSGFARWEMLFRGIIKSTYFPSVYDTTPNGLYRRFQDDGGVILPMNARNDGITIQ